MEYHVIDGSRKVVRVLTLLAASKSRVHKISVRTSYWGLNQKIGTVGLCIEVHSSEDSF